MVLWYICKRLEWFGVVLTRSDVIPGGILHVRCLFFRSVRAPIQFGKMAILFDIQSLMCIIVVVLAAQQRVRNGVFEMEDMKYEERYPSMAAGGYCLVNCHRQRYSFKVLLCVPEIGLYNIL